MKKLWSVVMKLLAKAPASTELHDAMHEAEAAGVPWETILATILAHSSEIITNMSSVVAAIRNLMSIFTKDDPTPGAMGSSK